MIRTEKTEAVADRLERIYLGLLRGLTLVVATICIIGAAFFAIDGGRRALMPTQVKPEPVSVSAEDALGPIVQSEAARKDAEQPSQSAVSTEARNAHAAFLKGPFEPYYQTYRKLAAAYNKPEDQILTKPQLAEHLGYTADEIASAADTAPAVVPESAADAAAADAAAAMAAALGQAPPADATSASDSVLNGLSRTANLFQTDAAYAEAQNAAVAKAAADPRFTAKARGYRTAEKTAQACRTDYEVRSVWDATSTGCANWYYPPYGCSVRRQVPVEKCEPAYPEGISSPLQLFTQLDESYRLSWTGKALASEAEAAEKTAQKEQVKAGAPVSLLLAVQIGGAFLVVMFLFLLIAVERHLRKVAQRRSEPSPPEPLALAAE